MQIRKGGNPGPANNQGKRPRKPKSLGRPFRADLGPNIPRAKDDMSRQLAAPAAKLSALMNKELTGKSIEQGSGEGKCNRVLKLGLDMHYRQVTVTMQEEEGPIKTIGR